MNKRLNKFFSFLGKQKVYFGNASMYALLLNYMLLLCNTKHVYGINVKFYVIVPLGLLFVGLIGYIDYKYIAKHQITHHNKINDIKSQLDRIERKIKCGSGQ
ncbi:MAG TPA: hypothetical protein ENH82_13440 [bacterium]|nr:hypothetical protein [bacterium]